MGKVLVWTTLTTFLLSLFQAIVLSGLVFLPAVPDLVLLVVLYVSFMNSSVIVRVYFRFTARFFIGRTYRFECIY
jgi:rod shape-determining protein MreD